MSDNSLNGVEQGMLAETRSEVAAADQKASMVLAALGVGFGALLAGLLAGDWTPTMLGCPAQAIWWLGAAAALGSIACAAIAVWPRFTKNDVSGGIYYWGHVATFRELEAFASFFENNPPDAVARTRHQLWRLSHVVTRKYSLVRAALVAAGAAAVLFIVSAIVG